MKLLFFDDFRLGVLKGETVVDVTDVVRDIPHLAPHDLMPGLIADFDNRRKALESAVAQTTPTAIGRRVVGPSAISAPTAMPAAGQKMAMPSGLVRRAKPK